MQFAPNLRRFTSLLAVLAALGAAASAYAQNAEPAAKLSYQPGAVISALELFGCGQYIGAGDEADWIVADLPLADPLPSDAGQALIACPTLPPTEDTADAGQPTERKVAVDFRSFADDDGWTDATDDADVFSFNTQASSDVDDEGRSGAKNFKISESVKIKAQPVGGGTGGRVTLTFQFPTPE